MPNKVKLKTNKILIDRCDILRNPPDKDGYGQTAGDPEVVATDRECRLLPMKGSGRRDGETQGSETMFTVFIMPWPSFNDQQLTEHDWLRITQLNVAGTKTYDVRQIIPPVLEGLPIECTVALIKP